MNCQYLNAVASPKNLMKSVLCNKPADKTGFCAEHHYCYEVLELARALDFPPYVIAYLRDRNGKVTKEAVYTVAAGSSSWQGYAVRHPKRRHEELMQRLRLELKDRLAKAA